MTASKRQHTVEEGAIPSRNSYVGDLGEPFYVLSIPEVRFAERVTQSQCVSTADGQLTAAPGEFLVSLRSGERYPVKPEVFFGSYEILSRAGPWYVGQRLIHVRRAWEVLSASAEFDYGSERGRLSANKGAWIYQSDEGDYGLINSAVNTATHIKVGPVTKLDSVDWPRHYAASNVVLTLVPPLLIAMAVCSLAIPRFAEALLSIEVVILFGALVLASWVRRERWSARAALFSGTHLACDFQCAVELLGWKTSLFFPTTRLWHAAQDESAHPPIDRPDLIRKNKELIGVWMQKIEHRIERYELIHRVLHASSWVAGALVLGCLVMLSITNNGVYKYLSIWLPSVVGAAHAWNSGQQTALRIGANRNLLAELKFARQQLIFLTPDDHFDRSNLKQCTEIAATLRMLCRSIARGTQNELRVSAAHESFIPI